MALRTSPSAAASSFKFMRRSVANNAGKGAGSGSGGGTNDQVNAFEDTKTVCACWTEDLQCFSFALRYSSTTVEQLLSTMKSFAWSAQVRFGFEEQGRAAIARAKES